jgi:DNA-binding response OmpR family regulator/HPt (histidine-containing phosphotransfer) domain-containing protein
MKILLIEDDDSLITLLTKSLSTQHHVVDAVRDGEMGWTYASTFDYNLIILDIMLPKLDGISLCKKLRSEGHTMPILLLTAQDHPTAKVQGLDAGADDYVVKPFDISELIARVRALLRRGSGNPLPLLSWGDLLLNPSTCDVTYDGQLLTLTTKEYDLLELFLRDSYHVFSSDEIIDRLWSSDDFPAEATVRSHLRRLRHKLQAAGANSDLIGTIHGRGYYLKSPESNHNTNTSPQFVRPTEQIDEAQQLLEQQQEQQYLAFLQETWLTTQPQCLENLTEMAEIIDQLVAGNCTYPQQQQVHQQAHKLVGTLGIFGLLSAMEIARTIERKLKRSTILNPDEAAILPAMVNELIQQVTNSHPQSAPDISSIELSQSHQPVLLLIDLKPNINKAITTIAEQQDCQVTVLSSGWTSNRENETVAEYLSNLPAESVFLPTVVLIALVTANELETNACLDFMQTIHQRFPHWSILLLSTEDSLQRRLMVAQHGGNFLVNQHLTPKEIFQTTVSLRRSATDPIKVMVVDDDINWLRALPASLQSWEMKVTTLADPPELLLILQLVQPDILILDIQMPLISGCELCQILRSDPHWQHLPIILLTGINNPETERQAFRSGADDYLHKPINTEELAQRIRHRLARIRVQPTTI